MSKRNGKNRSVEDDPWVESGPGNDPEPRGFKTKERVRQLGEVFTPPHIVEQMLDAIPNEVWADPSKTMLEPTCGNGNFLVAALRRKLRNGVELEQAVANIFGVDIMEDNVQESRARMLEIVRAELDGQSLAGRLSLDESRAKLEKILWYLRNNIRTGNVLEMDLTSWSACVR